MKDLDKNGIRPIRPLYYMVLLAFAWTLAISMSLAWNLYQHNLNTLEMARTQARVSYDKDLTYRRWSAGHGGVYVPVTDETPPNPYLDSPERTITTPSGRRLTLMNPAYMTRQLYELAQKQHGVLGHITSLNPIRPENGPDLWETEALKTFRTGETEVSSVAEIEGKSYMRLMRPLVTGEGCLKCHAAQGFKLGDIRGGISVSVPMEPLWAIAQKHALTLWLGHFFLWSLGLGALSLGVRHLGQRVLERIKAEEELKRQAAFVENNPAPVMQVEGNGTIVRCNAAAKKIFKKDLSGELLDNIFPEIGESFINDLAINKLLRFEHSIHEETFFFTIKSDEPTRSLFIYGSNITDYKRIEEELELAHRRVRNILDSALQVSIIATDPDGLITVFNTGAERMLGYTSDEMVNRQTPIAIHLESEVIAYGEELTAEYGRPVKGFEVFVLKSREGGYEEREWTYLKKDGEPVLVNLGVTAIRDSAGEITGFLGVATDITGRRWEQYELQKTVEELQRFNKLTTGREMRVIEMKKEVNALLSELGRQPQYRSVFMVSGKHRS